MLGTSTVVLRTQGQDRTNGGWRTQEDMDMHTYGWGLRPYNLLQSQWIQKPWSYAQQVMIKQVSIKTLKEKYFALSHNRQDDGRWSGATHHDSDKRTRLHCIYLWDSTGQSPPVSLSPPKSCLCPNPGSRTCPGHSHSRLLSQRTVLQRCQCGEWDRVCPTNSKYTHLSLCGCDNVLDSHFCRHFYSQLSTILLKSIYFARYINAPKNQIQLQLAKFPTLKQCWHSFCFWKGIHHQALTHDIWYTITMHGFSKM